METAFCGHEIFAESGKHGEDEMHPSPPVVSRVHGCRKRYRLQLCRRCCPLLLETVPAKHGTSLGRPERHCSLLAAFRTHSTGGISGRTVMSVTTNSQNPCPLRFTTLASLGFVPQLLVVEKCLLPGCEYKIRAAVSALQHLVPEFHGGCSFSLFPALRSRKWNILPSARMRRIVVTSPSMILPLGSARHALGWTWIPSIAQKTTLPPRRRKKGRGRAHGEERPKVDCLVLLFPSFFPAAFAR